MQCARLFPSKGLSREAMAFQFHNWTDADVTVRDCKDKPFQLVRPATKAERRGPPGGGETPGGNGTVPGKGQYAALNACGSGSGGFSFTTPAGGKDVVVWKGCGVPLGGGGYGPWLQADLGVPPPNYVGCNSWKGWPSPAPGVRVWVVVAVLCAALGAGALLVGSRAAAAPKAR
jgi:hypothetical protein